jgi:NAD-dependent deacetylase
MLDSESFALLTKGVLKKRVLVITGAGVSAESGIPTFRGRDGYWRNFDPTTLATPEAFTRDPKLVWEWYRERRERIRAARPNAAHHAIAKLAQHANEFLLVTQNVDNLHARAGLPNEKMVQIHGDIFVTRCSDCDFCRLDYERDQEEVLPRCTVCHALMRPGVVWFGEQLSWTKVQQVEDFLRRGACDVVIVIGTTATFGYIMDWALRAHGDGGAVGRAVPCTPFRGGRRAEECAPHQLIEVNPEETPLSRFATRLVREPAAVALPRVVDELINQGAL